MTIQDIIQQSEKLPTADKWHLVRYLLNNLETEKREVLREDWADFLERMYGALADDPIERPPQLPLTERDPIDS